MCSDSDNVPPWSARLPRVPKAPATETFSGPRGGCSPGGGGSGAPAAPQGPAVTAPGNSLRRGQGNRCRAGPEKPAGSQANLHFFFSLPTERNLRCLHRHVRRHTARLSHALRRLGPGLETPPRSAPGAGRDDVFGARRTFPAHARAPAGGAGLQKASAFHFPFPPSEDPFHNGERQALVKLDYRRRLTIAKCHFATRAREYLPPAEASAPLHGSAPETAPPIRTDAFRAAPSARSALHRPPRPGSSQPRQPRPLAALPLPGNRRVGTGASGFRERRHLLFLCFLHCSYFSE